jgi:hypothetical protein
MSRFKKYTQVINNYEFTIRYMGAMVEGCNKWYVYSEQFDIDQYTDSLWNTKQEAIQAAHEATLI